MTKFEQGKSYPTRSGGKAWIINIGADGRVFAAFYSATGEYSGTMTMYPTGRWTGDGKESPADILPPPPKTQTHWVNVAPDGDGGLRITGRLFAARAEAYERAPADRVGCHRITLRAEFEGDE